METRTKTLNFLRGRKCPLKEKVIFSFWNLPTTFERKRAKISGKSTPYGLIEGLHLNSTIRFAYSQPAAISMSALQKLIEKRNNACQEALNKSVATLSVLTQHPC